MASPEKAPPVGATGKVNTDPKDELREAIIRRPLYVYDLPDNILKTLTVKDGGFEKKSATPTDTIEKETAESKSAAGTKACSLCGANFHTVEDQRSHVRSDWHAYNLKQRLRKGAPVGEVEFEKLIGDLNESLSGSDSSDSEDEEDKTSRKDTTLSTLLKKQAAISSQNNENIDDFGPKKSKQGAGTPPLIWFETPNLPLNTYLGIYRSLFTKSEQEVVADITSIIQTKQIPSQSKPTGTPSPQDITSPYIFMCMIGGGHFAAMIVSLARIKSKNVHTRPPPSQETIVLAHKTFHRYTTRRKQGGSQSANDSAKGAAHSAGSSLRRYNEQALIEEVRLLLKEWKPWIDGSQLLFIRATGTTNKRTLFGPYEGQILHQSDPRIQTFPFNTRRATQKELLRSFTELTRVKTIDIDPQALLASKATSTKKLETPKTVPVKKDPPKLSEEEETLLLHTTQIQSLLRRSKLPPLLTYLSTNSLSPDFPFFPQNHHTPTPLHLSATLNSAPLILGLLLKAGADPCTTNSEGKTPYELTGSANARDAFRVARHTLGESAFPWAASKIPPGITQEEMDANSLLRTQTEKEEEEARRKRALESLPPLDEKGKVGGKEAERKRQEVLYKVRGKAALSAQEKREEEVRGLTPEMRMRLDRERRARAAEERMKKVSGGSGSG